MENMLQKADAPWGVWNTTKRVFSLNDGKVDDFQGRRILSNIPLIYT